jgi:hypothetical protein
VATLGDPSIAPGSVAFLLGGKALATVEGVASTYLWAITVHQAR